MWWHNSEDCPLRRAEVHRVLRRLAAEIEDQDRRAASNAENVRTLKIKPKDIGR